MVFVLRARSESKGRRRTPEEAGNTDQGTVPTSCTGWEGEFRGGPEGEGASGGEGAAGGGVAAAAGPVLVSGGVGAAGPGRRVSQRRLRAGFCDAVWEGAAVGARPAGTAALLPLPPTSVEETAAPPTGSSGVSWRFAAAGAMVCWVNLQSVDRILYSIFNRFDPPWIDRTLQLVTQAA